MKNWLQVPWVILVVPTFASPFRYPAAAPNIPANNKMLNVRGYLNQECLGRGRNMSVVTDLSLLLTCMDLSL